MATRTQYPETAVPAAAVVPGSRPREPPSEFAEDVWLLPVWSQVVVSATPAQGPARVTHASVHRGLCRSCETLPSIKPRETGVGGRRAWGPLCLDAGDEGCPARSLCL